MNLKQRLLSQNFLKGPRLVAHLVRKSGIGKNDIVVDIGAGTGTITSELAKIAGRVIAVEIDEELIPNLRKNLLSYSNVEIHHADIRQFSLPNEEYKVFANPPFHITGDIIYKLLQYSNPPTETYLVIQKEAAEKFTGSPHETQASILLKPYFDFKVVWSFKRSDFAPEPDVDAVFLHIIKRVEPMVSPQYELLYKSFIKFAFNAWKRDLKSGLKKIFTYEQWKRLAKDNNFNIHSKPTELKFNQWLAIFNFLLTIDIPRALS